MAGVAYDVVLLMYELLFDVCNACCVDVCEWCRLLSGKTRSRMCATVDDMNVRDSVQCMIDVTVSPSSCKMQWQYAYQTVLSQL